MTTMNDLVVETRRLVVGSGGPSVNVLETPFTAGGDTLALRYPLGAVQPGSIVSCGLCTFYVVDVNPSTRTLTVLSGHDGSLDTDLEAGARVLVRPTLTDHAIFSALNQEVRRLGSDASGLFRVGSWETTSNGVYDEPYPSPDGVRVGRLLGVWARCRDEDAWAPVDAYRVKRLDAGVEVQLLEPRWFIQNLRFEYETGFEPATSLDDDLEEVCGLPPSMHDIPPLGAAAELVLTAEARRLAVDAQGNARDPQEVPASSNATLARELRRQQEARIVEERIALTSRHPTRMGV